MLFSVEFDLAKVRDLSRERTQRIQADVSLKVNHLTGQVDRIKKELHQAAISQLERDIASDSDTLSNHESTRISDQLDAGDSAAGSIPLDKSASSRHSLIKSRIASFRSKINQ